ncbi:MAG TPA: glycosyltransferase family 1 protein [Candidatus Dormibacteraeota bacterium]|jgi:glycosyltransferase involved in cell wall biosynthesis|nr:glycosyltransferase family 1 protein [Candidatus Dormibacteraeota bacterium]
MTAFPLVDGRALQDRSAVRGIGTYVRGLCDGLAGLGVHPDLLLRAGEPPPPEAQRLGLRGVATVPVLKRRIQPVADPLLVMRILHALRPALYHAVEWAQPLRSPVPVVVTVHDLIPFLYPRLYPWMRRERLLALRLLRHAGAVIAVSRCTADDTVRLGRVDPHRITVVPHGVAPEFAPAAGTAVDALRRRLGLEGPYLLAVGTFDPRKRVDLLMEVAARIPGLTLAVAGDQGGYAGAVAEAARRAGVAARTRATGHLPLDDLVTLYSGAACLVFTSGYEGFGLPLLEAMACATPVVAFRNSALAEVGGPAAVLVDDGDAAALAAAAQRLLDDPAERAERVAAGRDWAAQFTWEQTARRTLEVYRSLAAL